MKLTMEELALRGITRAEVVEDKLAIAGYAGRNAPDDVEDYAVTRLAMAMRGFDATGGTRIRKPPQWWLDFNNDFPKEA